MKKLQLIKEIDGVMTVVNAIVIDADFVVEEENAGPGDIYDDKTKTFSKPEIKE